MALTEEALRLTSADLMELEVIDGVVEEPEGGAHRDIDVMATSLGRRLREELDSLKGFGAEELVDRRIAKFSRLGVYREQGPA